MATPPEHHTDREHDRDHHGCGEVGAGTAGRGQGAVPQAGVEDPDLREFYRELMISEAGHYTTFIGFARKYGGRIDVDQRWKEFLGFEADLILRYGKSATIHG